MVEYISRLVCKNCSSISIVFVQDRNYDWCYRCNKCDYKSPLKPTLELAEADAVYVPFDNNKR
jgi:hypothetical protein